MSVTIQPTRNMGLIETVVKHPKVWRKVLLHDGVPDREMWHIQPDENTTCLVAWRGRSKEMLGVFLLENLTMGVYRAHLALLPTAWGRLSTECCNAVVQWMGKHTDAHTIIAEVPEYNALCRSLVKRIGMRFTGRTATGIKQNGRTVLMDRFELGVPNE